jgi:hypothetical protein
MMDCGLDRGGRKDGVGRSGRHDGILTLVIFYPGKPRCLTPIILHFILCLCIKLKELNETHLLYIYIPYKSY